jgi:predicted nucleotidyltransferase component of viral defense system
VLHFDALPESTAELLTRLQDLDEVSGFTLIGGTALALQVRHRISEDLDLAWTAGNLPQDRIEAILKSLAGDEAPKLITDQAAALSAENDGIELQQTQQDWQIGSVKLTFFAPFMPAQIAVYEQAEPIQLGKLNILDADSVFALKSSLLFERKTSRDLFDLWYFIEHREKSVDDVLNAMDSRKTHYNTDNLLDRLAPASFRVADPGFQPLIEDAPATKEALLEKMQGLVSEYRADLAYQLAVAQHLGHGPSR